MIKAVVIPCVCTMAVSSAIANAAILVDETFEYYEVNGRTTSEIRSSIDANRLNGAGSDLFDARTDWQLTLNYQFHTHNNLCRVTHADVTVKLVYHLPALKSENWQSESWQKKSWQRDDDSKLDNRWTQYINALKTHELQHGIIARDAALELNRLVLASTARPQQLPNSSCTALEHVILKHMENIDRNTRQRQTMLDAVTNHGVTFP